MKRTNRNAWNSTEMETLLNVVQEAKSTNIGCKKAANLLGRTALACSYKYYQHVRNEKTGNKLLNVKTNLKNSTILSFKIKSTKIVNGYLTIEI
mgnify:CR=1 FL=1|tara:strand:- start:2720 stop:3001 length:282 start_codon:yes stop_codon:yes gene_type:complete